MTVCNCNKLTGRRMFSENVSLVIEICLLSSKIPQLPIDHLPNFSGLSGGRSEILILSPACHVLFSDTTQVFVALLLKQIRGSA